MVNMFSGNAGKKIPKNLKECYETDKISQSIWEWHKRVREWGKTLFWLIIIVGLVSAIASSFIVKEITEEVSDAYQSTYNNYYDRYDNNERDEEISTDTEISFDFKVFVISLIPTVIYAYIEYIIANTIALLIASLAVIVQDANITANVTLYKAAKEEGILNEENKKSVETQPKQNGFWVCQGCGRKNSISVVRCTDCGKYK